MKYSTQTITARLKGIEETQCCLRRNNIDDSPAYEVLSEEAEEWNELLKFSKMNIPISSLFNEEDLRQYFQFCNDKKLAFDDPKSFATWKEQIAQK